MTISILVAEDEAMIAMQIEMDLEDAGYRVVGPCMTLQACFDAVGDQQINAAVLDVDLAGYDVFPVAAELQKRGTDFVFHTGRGKKDKIVELFPDAPICTKPAEVIELLRNLDLPKVAP
ncbi:response regulator [Sulfitobacter sp. S190]|uniref:response regulator n=1 Tax=Sulfitobacter sp. S190 TaxID=2867022 RepID=UPI0021A880A7|nr:response regulator [Sulfitobacter sp. S190]UWR21229.1 response regulator [Sulfitobacter sp. S190]